MTRPLLVTLCTYNEAENLAAIVSEVLQYAPDADVLVVDDNSPDGTGQLADALADTDRRIHVVHRSQKLGLGTAIIAALQWGIEREYELLLNLDADFSHQPRHIPELRHGLEHADVAVGSRYVPGGGVEGWNWKRHVMSWSINVYARLLLGLKTRDNSGSFRCYRSSQLARLDWTRFRARGYAFQEEILYRCRRLGCRFVESPIVFVDRRAGQSKIDGREMFSALWVIFRLAIDRLCGVSVEREQPH